MRFTRPIRTIRAAAVTTAALGLVATSALSASADTPGTPDNDDIVIVGSDTTQLVWGDLAELHNGRVPTPARQLKTFDATGPSPITIRTGATIVRPNGSSAGVRELANPTTDPTTAKPVDVARSSRGRAAGDSSSVGFIRFAQDNLRWMANDDVTGVIELTDAQLTAIYNCQTTNWNQVGGPNLPIVPLIPQAGSGTRQAWLDRVEADPATDTCITDQNGTVQEHDPAPVQATPGSIAPVSQGRYNLLSDAEKAGTFVGEIPGTTDYDRDLFQVVRLTAAGEVADAGVADIIGDGFGGSSTGGIPFVCEASDPGTPDGQEAQEVIAGNGFTPITDGTCGTFE